MVNAQVSEIGATKLKRVLAKLLEHRASPDQTSVMMFAIAIAVLVTAFGLTSRRVLSRVGAEFLSGVGVVLLVIASHAAQWQFAWAYVAIAAAGVGLGAVIWTAEKPFRRRLIPSM